MSEIKVGDKVKVLNDGFGHTGLEVGTVSKVIEVDSEGVRLEAKNRSGFGSWLHFRNVELVKSKPSKKQRIETLEKEVSELKLIVHELRERKETTFTFDGVTVGEPSTVNDALFKNELIEFEGKYYQKVERKAVVGDVVTFEKRKPDVHEINKPYKVESKQAGDIYFVNDSGEESNIYARVFNRTPETVIVYEPIIQPVQRQTVPCSATRPPIEEVGEAFFGGANKVLNPKTANQLRGEVIEKAKGFVEEHLTPNTIIKSWNELGAIKGFVGLRHDTCGIPYLTTNEEKRTVTFVAKGVETKELLIKTVAQCHPNEVYNEHIGKAIALGRALGLDVSEFEQAVQPTVAIGQRIQSLYVGKDYGDPRYSDLEVTSISKFGYPKHENGMYTSDYKIINDTNAIYGGVE